MRDKENVSKKKNDASKKKRKIEAKKDKSIAKSETTTKAEARSPTQREFEQKEEIENEAME
jgi:hypothetical protein